MLMTREQIQKHLQIGKFTLRALMHSGRVPFLRINNKFVRFDPEKVEAALAKEFEGKAAKRSKGAAAAKERLEKARILILEKRRAAKQSRKPTREKKPTTT